MNRILQLQTKVRLAVPLILLAALAGLSQAQTERFYLAAQPFSKTMPGGEVIPMWGFAEYDSIEFSTLISEPNIPGPMLGVPNRNRTLEIHLKNELTVPVSLVIPGLSTPMNPVFFFDDQGRRRVRSFTHETAPGATVIYSWTSLKAGSFMYQSGTHPQVQVQMGLYGGLQVNFNLTNVYQATGIPNIVPLYFSEIDPALHKAVATGNYGPGKYMTSTMDFDPKYFLINGQAYYMGMPPIYIGEDGDDILLRFYNAGLESHFPMLPRLYMNVFAEDGNLYPPQPFVNQPPYPKYQYSLLLAAGQAKDAFIGEIPAGLYTLYDRSLDLTNDANSPGGMRVQLQVGAITPNIPPVISTISATPSLIPPGACTTQLSVTAFDPNDFPETPLVISWNAPCGYGTFNDPTIAAPIFTFSEYPGPGVFTFTVYISDGADTTIGTVDVEFVGAPEPPLIIDNRDATVIREGVLWRRSNGDNPYGTDSEYSTYAGDKFTFYGPRNGENLVEMRWTWFSNRSSNVSVEIWDDTTLLDDTIVVDQTATPSTWITLGTYTFTGTAKVVVVSTGVGSTTNADAVRFTSTAGVYAGGIEIVGPTLVGDTMGPTNYDIRVTYSDATTGIVEATDWSVVDTGASIDAAGILTVPDVTTDTPAVITAEYTNGGCPYTATLGITITDGIVATELIVDNLGDTTESGNWIPSTGADPWDGQSVYSGTNGHTFTFNADLLNVPYAVYMHWTYWSNRRTSVPVQIVGGPTDTTVNVNQRSNPGMWNLLGVYTLGPNTEVTLTSLGGGTTNADAVRFVPLSSVTELIIDNYDPGASATSGTWHKSGGANPYGSESLWNNSVDGTYTYIIDITGTFDIDAYWTYFSNRYTAVPYEIYDGAAVTPMLTITKNQQLNGGGWNSLATDVNFTEFVRIVIRSESGSFTTCADAIRLVPAGE